MAFAAVASVVAVAGPSGTAVVDVGALMSRASAALARREWASVIRELSEALSRARAEAPLQVSRVVVVDGPHVGLGVYSPVAGGRVLDRRLRLYVEVENLVTRALPDGDVALGADAPAGAYVVEVEVADRIGVKNARQSVGFVL